MEANEQAVLQALETDIKTLKEALKETANEIVKEGYSRYPIIIAHAQELAFADKIIDRELFQSNFHFSASTLEAMVEKGIILKERKAAMEQQMNTSESTVCFLLLHPEHMRFIFYPL